MKSVMLVAEILQPAPAERVHAARTFHIRCTLQHIEVPRISWKPQNLGEPHRRATGFVRSTLLTT
jgi:hypothetical protein